MASLKQDGLAGLTPTKTKNVSEANMRPTSFRFISLAATPILSVCITATGQSPAKALHDLFDREWDYQMQQSPTRASTLGDRRWNASLRNISLEALQQAHAHGLDVLAQLS